MSNSQDHHDRFSNPGVRDVVARSLSDHQVTTGCHGDVKFRATFREHLVDQLKKAERAVDAFDEGVAMWHLMDKMGWDEHDHSSWKGYDPATYRAFIGTREEFEHAFPEYTKTEGGSKRA